MCIYCVYYGMLIVKWNYCDGLNYIVDLVMINKKYLMDIEESIDIIVYNNYLFNCYNNI